MRSSRPAPVGFVVGFKFVAGRGRLNFGVRLNKIRGVPLDIFAVKFRTEMLRKIGARIKSKENAMVSAEKEAARLRNEYTQLQQAELRLKNEVCPSGICPDCFFMRHKSSPLRAISSSSEDVDLFKCETCNHTWEKHDES